MSAVWRAARGAVRRRRLQTFVIGLVVLMSTGTIVVALGLVDAASAPFDRAFGKQRGAHAVATFDPGKASDAQLARAARQPGVEASAGPFRQAVLDLPRTTAQSFGLDSGLAVVGRAGPGGPVDRLDLWAGRWATRPGEIVLNRSPGWGTKALGKQLKVPGGPSLTIVGYAFTLSRSADAWVAPGQIASLRPAATQMLFRFEESSTEGGIRSGLSAVTAGLPPDSLTASQSYLTVKQQIGSSARAYAPYLMAFGILGVLVAVLIVGNVVSGAVISGFRHIGILKAIGFTPGQVVGVYLAMVSVPAVVGCVFGTVIGNVLARPLLEFAFTGPDAGVLRDSVGGVPTWVNAVALLGLPSVVVLAALIPALRAHRMSAARAISAGSAQRTGRALRIQRRLAGSGLPRSVSLGLGLPFARPGRSALTLVAVVLGVTTVTFATGLATTMTRFGSVGEDAYQVVVYTGSFKDGRAIDPEHGDRELESLLRSLPGAREVTARGYVDARAAGYPRGVDVEGRRGDRPAMGDVLVEGRWMRDTDEIVAPTPFLRERGLEVGDSILLEKGDRRERVTVVGEAFGGNARNVYASWVTMTALAPQEEAIAYHVKLAQGTDTDAYMSAARAADAGVSLTANGPNAVTQTIISSASILTLMLAAVASLGVFNTVVLNTRERRRDLGMLKSIGMTPRQVTVMMVSSMAALGVAGGLLGIPLGIAGHHLIVPEMAEAADLALPAYMTDVWQPLSLTALTFAGLTITSLGAFVPSRRAARLTIAEVLHNE
ncbi:FtsX-like permease family protein [Streptomyces yerevanensis]|uniref:ABC transporter permease n=1 Tax=Streptomyces yerevanensis TaxID=66378 RepID=UPI0005262895|nr:FtsX-like permease family protein [Streptomyces yerevanensis]